MRNGMPLPKKIQNAPELIIGLDFYFNAFEDLHLERAVGLTEGRIPLSAIKSYSMDLELDEEQRDNMVVYIQRMDAAYLNYARSKSG